MLLAIVVWILLGGLAGWIASLLLKRNAEMGIIANIGIGIGGAIAAGLLMSRMGTADMTGFNLYGLGAAILGAVVLLFLLTAQVISNYQLRRVKPC